MPGALTALTAVADVDGALPTALAHVADLASTQCELCEEKIAAYVFAELEVS